MSAVRAATRAQMREIDRITIEEVGIPGMVLMENAGRGVARALLDFTSRSQSAIRNPKSEIRDPSPAPPYVIVCGKGNNGGDGCVIARVLHELGHPVRVFLAGRLADHLAKDGDAARQVRILQKLGMPLEETGGPALNRDSRRPAPGVSGSGFDAALRDARVVIDALLGTGLAGPVKPDLADLIGRINACGRPVCAVDLPSGLDADEGTPLGAAVKADLTCTLGLPKPGFFKNEGPAHVGELRVVEIGIPPEVIRRVTTLE